MLNFLEREKGEANRKLCDRSLVAIGLSGWFPAFEASVLVLLVIPRVVGWTVPEKGGERGEIGRLEKEGESLNQEKEGKR